MRLDAPIRLTFILSACFAASMLLSACSSAHPDAPLPFKENPIERVEAIVLLKHMKTKDFQDAFHQTKKGESQFSNTFQNGAFTNFQKKSLENIDPTLATYFLPDSTSYLPVDRQEQYLYKGEPVVYPVNRVENPTTPNAAKITVVANPRDAKSPEWVEMEFVILREGHRLVSMQLKRQSSNLMFEEDTTTRLETKPQGTHLAPSVSSATVFTKTLWGTPQHYAIKTTYP